MTLGRGSSLLHGIIAPTVEAYPKPGRGECGVRTALDGRLHPRAFSSGECGAGHYVSAPIVAGSRAIRMLFDYPCGTMPLEDSALRKCRKNGDGP